MQCIDCAFYHAPPDRNMVGYCGIRLPPELRSRDIACAVLELDGCDLGKPREGS
jgi:hypothetical protein